MPLLNFWYSACSFVGSPSQQYFSLTINQHQSAQTSPETNQRTGRLYIYSKDSGGQSLVLIKTLSMSNTTKESRARKDVLSKTKLAVHRVLGGLAAADSGRWLMRAGCRRPPVALAGCELAQWMAARRWWRCCCCWRFGIESVRRPAVTSRCTISLRSNNFLVFFVFIIVYYILLWVSQSGCHLWKHLSKRSRLAMRNWPKKNHFSLPLYV